MNWSTFSKILSATATTTTSCSDVELLRCARDRVLSIKEFANLHRQMGGDDRTFDKCLPCLKYEFYPKNSLILATGRTRERFYFILEGFCGVFGPRDESSLANEVKLLSQLQEQEVSMKHWTGKLSLAESLEEEFFIKQTSTQIQSKINQLAQSLTSLKAKTDASRLKEAIINEGVHSTSDTTFTAVEKAKLLSKHFSARQCIFAKESELSSGDGLDEINVSSSGQSSLIKKTVITLQDSHMLSISVEDYTRVFSHSLGQLVQCQRMMRSYFPAINEDTVQQLSLEFRSKYYERNESIYRQGGSNPTSFFLLLQGTVEIRKYTHTTEAAEASTIAELTNDNKRGSAATATDGYASLMILSGKQVIGAECVGRFNEYSAVSISTETKVMVLDKKKFEVFDHQFNFRKFFAEQSAVQRTFFAERLASLTAFDQQRKQENSQQQASKQIIQMITQKVRSNRHISISKEVDLEVPLNDVVNSSSSTTNLRMTATKSALRSISLTATATANMTTNFLRPNALTSDILEQRFEADERNRIEVTSKDATAKEISRASNEGSLRFISSGFDFENDAAKIRRKQILIGHKVSKYFSTRGSHLSSIVKDQLVNNSEQQQQQSRENNNSKVIAPAHQTSNVSSSSNINFNSTSLSLISSMERLTVYRRGEDTADFTLSQKPQMIVDDYSQPTSSNQINLHPNLLHRNNQQQLQQQVSLQLINDLPQVNHSNKVERSLSRRSKIIHSKNISQRDSSERNISSQSHTATSSMSFRPLLRSSMRSPSIQVRQEESCQTSSPFDRVVEVDSFAFSSAMPISYSMRAEEHSPPPPLLLIPAKPPSREGSSLRMIKVSSTKSLSQSNIIIRSKRGVNENESATPSRSQRVITSFLKREEQSKPQEDSDSTRPSKRNLLASSFIVSSSGSCSDSPMTMTGKSSSDIKSSSSRSPGHGLRLEVKTSAYTDRKSIFSPLSGANTDTFSSRFKAVAATSFSAFKSPLKHAFPFKQTSTTKTTAFPPFGKTRDFLVL